MTTARSLLAVVVLALAAVAGRPASANPGAEASKFVENMANVAIRTVADKQISDQLRTERFRQLFVGSFDIPEIARFVLSRHWRSASTQQRERFVSLFEDMTVLTWAKRFKEYGGETLKVVAVQPENDDWLVISEIVRPQQAGQPVHVRWRLRQETAGWRVVDIIVEDVSMALTQRQDFAAVLQGNGGSVDALLDTLQNKVEQLRKGG